jgi:hypothetical protein
MQHLSQLAHARRTCSKLLLLHVLFTVHVHGEADNVFVLLMLQAAAGGLSYVDSQANPMCSPSTSAFFSARDERSSFCSAGASLQDEYSQAASMATCESSSILVSNAAL